MERCPVELINFFQGNTPHLVKFDKWGIAWKEQIFIAPSEMWRVCNFTYSVQLAIHFFYFMMIQNKNFGLQ